jgi:hypothetical protein
MTDPAVTNAVLQAQKARHAQQLLQLADQFATTPEAAGRQEAGQIAAPAAAQGQRFWTGLQSNQALVAAVAQLLVFAEPAPPAATVAPIRTSDGMFGDIGGRPTDATVH